MNIDINIPKKLLPIFTTDKRYIVLHSGRGAGKSWAVADYIIAKCMEKPIRVLATREIMNSIKDSVHKLLCDRIHEHKIESHFNITDRDIKCKNGSEILFKGLHRNINSIKSTEGIDVCFVEEAHSVSRKSLDILIPTIRQPNSKIIFAYNPTNEDDPVHVDFTLRERDDTLNIGLNYLENPYFPEVLKDELEYDKKTDYDKYRHIWMGECVTHSEEQVFYGKWKIEDFETPENAEFFHGLDFGFSADPLAAVRCFIKDDCLYIDREAYKLNLEITETADYLKECIETIDRWSIIADSARPEMISHLRNQHGFNIRGAKKGKGSIEDGIAKIRGFVKIFIHPNCKHTIDEFRHYKWKKNKLTDEIMPVPEDKHNHIIDGIRYGLERYGRNIKITRY